MIIERVYTKNALRNYDFKLSLESGEVIIVDPSDNEFVRNLNRCDVIFLTHEHYDHTVGIDEIIQKYNPKIYCHESIEKQIPGDVIGLKDNDIISIGAEEFKIVYIPGHIPSHIGFLHEKNMSAFLGDTVFNGGVGNTRSGSVEELADTIINKVKKLDDEYIIYSEHDYWKTNLEFTLSLDPDCEPAKKLLEEYNSRDYIETGEFPAITLGEEKQFNLFFRTHEQKIKNVIISKLNLAQDASEKDIFIGLRTLRNNW